MTDSARMAVSGPNDIIYPASNKYQVLGDAPSDLVQPFPRPRAGRFVLVLPPKTEDGRADREDEPRYVPVRPFLAVAWQYTSGEPTGTSEVFAPTDGYLVTGDFQKAHWLPEGWHISTFPAGWERPHLESWFEYAIYMAGLKRGDLPRDAEKGPASCPAGRQLVAHAYMIVRHLKLNHAPVEPSGPMTPAGCEGQLREVLHFLLQTLSHTPASEPVHNADFTMVHWYGTEYCFALGVQSGAVRALWEEWQRSRLGLHQDSIRQAIDSARDEFRMDNTFRNHPAFGTMIQRCGDGRYRLAAPDAQSAQPGMKSERPRTSAPKSRQKRT